MLVVGFDLDDTLFYEWRFVASAAVFICHKLEQRFNENFDKERKAMIRAVLRGERHFDVLEKMLSERGVLEMMTMRDIVSECRNHLPILNTAPGAVSLFENLKKDGDIVAIITDGRSLTQRNKIRALGITDYFSDDNIFISQETGFEKNSGYPFQQLMKQYPDAKDYYYIGDNIKKDVEAPKALGWKTIIVADKGYNIHRFEVECEIQPDFRVNSLKEIYPILKNSGG